MGAPYGLIIKGGVNHSVHNPIQDFGLTILMPYFMKGKKKQEQEHITGKIAMFNLTCVCDQVK